MLWGSFPSVVFLIQFSAFGSISSRNPVLMRRVPAMGTRSWCFRNKARSLIGLIIGGVGNSAHLNSLLIQRVVIVTGVHCNCSIVHRCSCSITFVLSFESLAKCLRRDQFIQCITFDEDRESGNGVSAFFFFFRRKNDLFKMVVCSSCVLLVDRDS